MITRKLVSGSHHLFHTSRYSQPLFSRFYTCASPQSTSILRPCPVSFHHYSTTAESQSSDSSSEVPPPPSSSSSPDPSSREQDPIKQQIDAKDREIIDLKDRYLRSVADFRNLQDRTKRDVDQARQFAISRFARDLIESVDNFDLALSTVDRSSLPPSAPDSTATPGESGEELGNKQLNDLYQGLRMTEKTLMQTLKKHGLERFDPSAEGEKFDPSLHDAAFMTKMDDREDGTVFSTMQKGFLLNGRVVRAAKVGVVKNN